MVGFDTTSPANEAESELQFFTRFANPTPGSVILQSDGALQLCFYAPLPLLAYLSSFFSNLPPPSPTDLVDGYPLIPLSDATFQGLAILLLALQSTLSPAPFRLDPTDFYRTVDILDAALIAKRYDIPIVFRLLEEALQNAYLPSAHELPLTFAIWAIAGVAWKTSSAAEAMVNNYDITHIPKDIVAALARHAPDAITQLQSLQLRYYSAPARLLQACKMVQCQDCPDPECAGEGEQLESSFFAALKGRSVAERGGGQGGG